jgi:GT2 family glycosyltransferase/glycosyltransferase involved in cell wall biosynthesis/tetratricopeptide (TPR) repeat protein
MNPDIYLSLAVCCLLQRYIFVREPLSLNVISRQSNGFSHSNDHADKEVGRRVMQDNDRPYHPDLPFSDDLHIAHLECLLHVRDAGLLPHDIPIEFKVMFGQAVRHTYACYQSQTREKRLGQLKQIASKHVLLPFMEEVEPACQNKDIVRLTALVPTTWVHPPYDYDAQIGRHLVLSPQGAALLAGELIRTDRVARGRCLNRAGRFLDTARAEHDQSKMATLAERYRHMISSTVGELWTRPEFIRCYISNVKSRLLAFNPASYLWALSGTQEEAEAQAKSSEPMVTQRGGGAGVDSSTKESSANKPAEGRIVGGRQFEERMTLSIFLTDANSGDARLGLPYFCGNSRYGWKGTFARPQMEQVQGGGEQVWLLQRLTWVSDDTLERAQRSGTRIVHDLDDLLWDIPEDNPNKAFLTDSRIEMLFRHLNRANQVTVSTEPLAHELSRKGIRALVLPNCVAPERWKPLRPVRRAGKRPRVGWAGQRSVHFADLELLRQVMDDLGDEVEWVFLGDTPVFARESGRQVESFSMVPIQNYPAQLAALNLDLALAPLAMNRFNEAKSDIRLLHYGALGYPVVASDIVPHRLAPVKLVTNRVAAWVEAIRERIADPDAAAREGEQLREWVFANRSIDVWIAKYAEAWFGRSRDGREVVALAGSRATVSQVPTFSCSIIMPVLNNVELTRQSLTALAEVTDGCEYEVIVVDNHSTDGTQEFLSSLGGDVQIIRNSENRGFAKACNQGAQAARGKYLIFLNNDTIPIKGWLNALVQEVEAHQDVGVVGSKLLYADGTVQHAGVVFSRKWLTPYHHHRTMAADAPIVNRRREFQSVTAACMLVRHDLFSEVGGFDEAYRNGFEDVDLCLKVKQQGWRVIYQPSSVLYHLESQTPGRKDHDVENHRLFTARWGACWWLTDEDLMAFQDGFRMEYLTANSAQWRPFENTEERRCWQLVAETQQAAGQRDNATVLKKLERCAEWPADHSVLKWAASVAEVMKQPALASAFMRRVMALDDPAAEELGNIREALAKGQVTIASTRLDALLKCYPLHADGQLLKAILHMQREQYEQAETAFDVAMQQRADRKKCLMGMGMAAMGRASTQGAWERFLQVLTDYPDDAEAIHWLIRAGTAQNRWDELSQHLCKYLVRNPADLAIRFALAGALVRGEQIEAASLEYETLRALAPTFDGLNELGQAITRKQAVSTMEAAHS